MSNLKRATGTSVKARRCVGWGGKGSAPSRSEPYRSKRGRACTRWMGAVKTFANPHQGARECARRAKS